RRRDQRRRIQLQSLAVAARAEPPVSPVWGIRQGSGVSMEPCGEMVAVHLNKSGITHLVDPVSAEVLRFLGGGPESEARVRGFVAELLADHEIGTQEVLDKLLRPLQSSGLIELLS
ncbi:MAG: hypothetical protein ABJC19_02310, partial [Gemmatimonadota bacterium]